MTKDVIYIDTEDDITAIIDKMKHSKAQIVALVPPKRVGVLQSTVNLKLLQRAAEKAEKRPVLITSDAALTALASGLAIPIAKNLQSKPEIASLETLESEGEEIIHGEDIAVGDFADMAQQPATSLVKPSDTAEDTVISAGLAATALGEEINTPKSVKPPKYAGAKIPNFTTFRKKLFLLGGLGVLVVGFLVWALFFASRATIAITAKTNIVNINKTLQLKSNVPLDVNQAVLPVITRQVKKTVSIDFTPTGTKNVGDKAIGTVKFANNSTSARTIAAGTQLTGSGNQVFATNAAVTIPAGTVNCPTILTCTGTPGTASGDITASAPGASYNNVSGNLSGAPSNTTATMAAPTSGGTDKTVTVVTADDIAKATSQLTTQDSNAVKDELTKQFASDEIIIAEAYIVVPGAPVSTPAVDQEATAAKLTSETTYTLLGVKRADLKAVYDAYLATQLKGDTSQKVYQSGDEQTQFSSFQAVDGGYSVRAIGMAQVGPNIDSAKVAHDAGGKQIGEVKQSLESIQGIDNVDVTLSPFWVNRVPTDASRVTVTFVLKNE